MKNDRIPMIQIDDTIISIDCLSEKFCCDLDACKGECCIEGDAGAPVELDEVAELEEALPVVWPWLSASAQAVIDRQGVGESLPRREEFVLQTVVLPSLSHPFEEDW